MKTLISMSSDLEKITELFGAYERAKVSGGVEYSCILPKASAADTMAKAQELTKKLHETFGERRIGGTYITNQGGKTIFVAVIGTDLTIVK